MDHATRSVACGVSRMETVERVEPSLVSFDPLFPPHGVDGNAVQVAVPPGEFSVRES